MSHFKEVIKSLRTDFISFGLDESAMDKNPIHQFEMWMQNAIDAKADEPNAMTLATLGKNKFPDARIVLLRGVDKKGFSFFTNYKSTKGKEMHENKNVCINFFWIENKRQVRIKGTVEKLGAKESDEYFNSRPRESQISAHASQQSEMLTSRKKLDEQFSLFEKKFSKKNVPRPKHWGGYIVKPLSIEFWQGRSNRLHDRILYTKLKSGKWKMQRIAP